MTDPFLAALFLVGAAVGVVWWFRGRRVETFLSTGDSVVAHLVMNLGMAVMATPLYTGGTRGALIGTVGALGAYYALRLVTRDGDRRARRSADAYHLVAAAAMVFALVLLPAGTTEMPGMPGMPAGHDMGSGAAAPVAGVLAVLFALDALGTAGLVVFAPARVVATASSGTRGGPPPAELPSRDRRDLRIAAVPHVVMDVGMVWMLLA